MCIRDREEEEEEKNTDQLQFHKFDFCLLFGVVVLFIVCLLVFGSLGDETRADTAIRSHPVLCHCLILSPLPQSTTPTIFCRHLPRNNTPN